MSITIEFGADRRKRQRVRMTKQESDKFQINKGAIKTGSTVGSKKGETSQAAFLVMNQ
jgi:hypothetical protein